MPTSVTAYDPMVSARAHGEQREGPLEGISIVGDAGSACEGADVVVLLTEWPEFRELDLSAMASRMAGTGLVDARNLLDPDLVRRRV